MLFIKNIKNFFLLFTLVLCLVACGDKKADKAKTTDTNVNTEQQQEGSKTFVFSNDATHIEVTYTYVGDKVIRQSTQKYYIILN